MKKNIMTILLTLFVQQIIQAQGTTYVSNLRQPSTGSYTVGSDSWYATSFVTGNNPSGYLLNSVQLAMNDASGAPIGFSVMIYKPNPLAVLPKISLGSLSGSDNPSTAGIYTYTDGSNITLSPDTVYFIVLTASTAIANGSYDWSVTDASNYNPSDNWNGGGDAGRNYESSNGSLWYSISGAYPEFAITATAIPEPSAEMLLGFGGILLLGFLSRREGKGKA